MEDIYFPTNFKKDKTEIRSWFKKSKYCEAGDIFQDPKLFAATVYRSLEGFLGKIKNKKQNYIVDLLQFKNTEGSAKLDELNAFLSLFVHQPSFSSILPSNANVFI